MDIRTKLVFTLVLVALGSMLAIGAFTYRAARGLILEERLVALDGLAESRKDALAAVFAAWADRTRLIATRTRLRERMARLASAPDRTAATDVQRILDDALTGVDDVHLLAAYSRDGGLIAQATRGDHADTLPGPETSLADVDEVRYDGLHPVPGGGMHVRYVAGLAWEGRPVGQLVVHMEPSELDAFVASRSGLGETGEVLVAATTDRGPSLLHAPRHDPSASTIAARDSLVRLALSGAEGLHRGGLVDYRGEPVWAATRSFPEMGWGLVVKSDMDEALEPLLAFRRQSTELGISLAAFAILLGTLLGLWFAKPIHDLAAAAQRVGEGDLDARVDVSGRDEVGLLARAFNRMAGDLQSRMTDLHEFRRIFELSQDLMCIAGTDGYFKRVNPAFTRTLGWKEAELLESPFESFVHPDDVAATRAEVVELTQGIPTVSFENRYRTSDGGYVRLRWTSFPVPEEGRLYATARIVPNVPTEA